MKSLNYQFLSLSLYPSKNTQNPVLKMILLRTETAQLALQHQPQISWVIILWAQYAPSQQFKLQYHICFKPSLKLFYFIQVQ